MKLDDNDYCELSKYAELDGTEVGGYVCNLLCLRDSTESHGMSSEFSESLDKELHHWLSRFRNETEIVIRTEPQPDKRHDVLVWLYS